MARLKVAEARQELVRVICLGERLFAWVIGYLPGL